MADGDLYWFRVSANVMARDAKEAEAIVASVMPPVVDGSLAPSHVCNVEDAQVYRALVDWSPADPGPRPAGEENGAMIAFIATSAAEVREHLLTQFDASLIGEIRPL